MHRPLWIWAASIAMSVADSSLGGAAINAATSCFEQGFAESLRCSTCNQLAELVTDESLANGCRACCQQDDKLTSNFKHYAAARLILDKRSMATYKELQSFIDQQASNYSTLQIVWQRQWRPTLLLFDNSQMLGEPAEVLSVDRWDRAAMQEYLSHHLVADVSGT